MNNKYYRVTIGKDKITIYSKEPNNTGILKIMFASTCLNVNPNIINMVYNDIVIYLSDRFNVALSLSGENIVHITKNQFILQGYVRLDNVKLTNPILDNVNMSYCDFSKSTEVIAIRATVRECKSKTSLPLKFYLINVYRQSDFERHIKKLTN